MLLLLLLLFGPNQEGEYHPRGKSHNFHTGSEFTLTGPAWTKDSDSDQAEPDKGSGGTNEEADADADINVAANTDVAVDTNADPEARFRIR